MAYFFDGRISSRRDILTAVKSLLYQLLSGNRDLFRNVYGKPVFNSHRGLFTQYAQALQAVLSHESLGRLFIVIDALDECAETSLPMLLGLLTTLQKNPKVKILLTSRELKAEEALIPSQNCLNLDQLPEHSKIHIQGYIEFQVEQLVSKKRFLEPMKRDILAKLISRSAPATSFLWVQLALRTIENQQTIRTTRSTLNQISHNLDKLFLTIITRTEAFPKESLLLRSLYLVKRAKGPLRAHDLSTFLAIWECLIRKERLTLDIIDENRNIELEGHLFHDWYPLLKVEEGTVTLVHESLSSFLETADWSEFRDIQLGNNSRPAKPRSSPVQTQQTRVDVRSIMAEACLKYMFAFFDRHGAIRSQDYSTDFIQYSSTNWTEHLREAGKLDSQRLGQLLSRLFESDCKYAFFWHRMIADFPRQSNIRLLPTRISRLMTLATFDLCERFGDNMLTSRELTLRDEKERGPLHFAVVNDALSSVKWILEKQRQLRNIVKLDQVMSVDADGLSPLHYAAKYGNVTMFEVLLRSSGHVMDFDPLLLQLAADNEHRTIFSKVLREAPPTSVTDKQENSTGVCHSTRRTRSRELAP